MNCFRWPSRSWSPDIFAVLCVVPVLLVSSLLALNGHGQLTSASANGGEANAVAGQQRQIRIQMRDSTWAEIVQAARTAPFDWAAFLAAMGKGESELELARLHTLHSNRKWALDFHRVRVAREASEETTRSRTDVVAVSIVPKPAGVRRRRK